jgi:uncharacterized protein
MYGELNTGEIDALLARNRYGRIGFSLDGDIYILPINYGYASGVIYGHATVGSHFAGYATNGTKVRGMRQNETVAFEVDEIENSTHWRSVLLRGRVAELRNREEKKEAFAHIVSQAGGGERSDVTLAIDLDHLVVFTIEVKHRSGRFEQREAYELRPLPKGPLPPAPGAPVVSPVRPS